MIASFLVGVVVGATIVGVINISYVIEPSTEEAVTLSPNPITLDLKTIPAKSVGTIDFGNSCRLSLSAGYTLKFELDETTIEDFDSFEVWLEFHEVGTTYVDYLYLGWELGYIRWRTLDAGDYDVHIKVEYDAKDLTEATSGQAVITLSY